MKVNPSDIIFSKQVYESLQSKDRLRRDITKEFYEKYFRDPYRMKELGPGTAERLKGYKFSFFIPGRIYAWNYQNPIYKDVLDFYDVFPFVLVHKEWYCKNTGNHLVSGINLNFFPELERVNVLDIHFRLFEKIIRKAIDKIYIKNALGIMNEFSRMISKLSWVINSYNSVGVNYMWSYRTYARHLIKKPTLVELTDWKYLPFYIPKEFEKKGLQEVWTDYVLSKTKK